MIKKILAGLAVVVVMVVVAIIMLTFGCAIVPARYELDREGKPVMVEPERVVPAPIVVNAYPVPPVVYTEPVYYPAPVYYSPPVVVYERPYRVCYERPVVRVGGGGHRRHR